MNRLVVAALVRNEAERFWPSALDAWSQFADAIVVLDDQSGDATAELARDAGASVYVRGDGVSAWGAESPARAELWDRAMQETEPGDWILILDADMVPLRNPRPLLAPGIDAVAFPLFDLWLKEGSRLWFREDGFWQGHLHPRLWAVRRPETPENGWKWSERGIHTGHFPLNLSIHRAITAPLDYSLLHYAYLTPALREAKAAAYEATAAQLLPAEQAHAISILHPQPRLAVLPFTPAFPLNLSEARNAPPADSFDHERPSRDPDATSGDDPVADEA